MALVLLNRTFLFSLHVLKPFRQNHVKYNLIGQFNIKIKCIDLYERGVEKIAYLSTFKDIYFLKKVSIFTCMHYLSVSVLFFGAASIRRYWHGRCMTYVHPYDA